MKTKFIMINTKGRSMQNELNKVGREGWHYVKMEPFIQQQKMTASHGVSKFAVCVEQSSDMISYYRSKFIDGNSQSTHSFRIDDINEYNKRMERCGFEFKDFHHVFVLHLDPRYNTRRSMKGYLCLWEISLDRDMAENMIKRIDKVTEVLRRNITPDKLNKAPFTSQIHCIKEKLEKYKEERDEISLGGILPELSPGKEEKILVEKIKNYEYLKETVKRIIDLDNKELKKQMGKDWDDGLAAIKPDIESVINSLSYDFSIENFVEEVLWSIQGNLISSSLPESLQRKKRNI